MRPLRRGRLRLAVLALAVVVAVACLFVAPGSPRAAAPSALPEVKRQGNDLVAAGERFRAWGFNYGIGDRYPILRYFDRPTERRLQRVVADMREARLLGANTLRVYLEIDAFMNGPDQPDAAGPRCARDAARRGGAAQHLPRPHRQPRVASAAALVRRATRTGSMGGPSAILAGDRTNRAGLAGGTRLRAHERAGHR